MTSTFVEAMAVPEVADAARRILAGVGFHGLVEVEFKYDRRDERYKILDANTRAWAWIGLGSRAGVDFPYLAWQLATGQQIAGGVAARPARWIYPSRDLLAIFQAWKRLGKLDAGALGAIFKASSLANFAWDDPLPGLADLPIQAKRWARQRLRRRG